MVSFDYRSLDAALLAANVVVVGLVVAVILLLVGWLSGVRRWHGLMRADRWLLGSVIVSSMFFAAFVAVDAYVLWRGQTSGWFMLAWPAIWMALAWTAWMLRRRSFRTV